MIPMRGPHMFHTYCFHTRMKWYLWHHWNSSIHYKNYWYTLQKQAKLFFYLDTLKILTPPSSICFVHSQSHSLIFVIPISFDPLKYRCLVIFNDLNLYSTWLDQAKKLHFPWLGNLTFINDVRTQVMKTINKLKSLLNHDQMTTQLAICLFGSSCEGPNKRR